MTETPRVGHDIKLPSPLRSVKGATEDDPLTCLDRTAELGLDGILFRTLPELSATLDRGYLRELAARAAERDVYLEVGVGKVNPYMTLELPEIRELGGGSYLRGMELLVETAAELGWTELWSALAGYKGHLGTMFSNDRYRTDVDWADQLDASTRFLAKLAPCLRDCGVHLNLETHEEVTTFELVRIVETIGPDVLGVTLDTANVVVHGEDPLAATARVAPYVRMTHLRDVALFATEHGLSRYLVPCGEGVIDWVELLSVLEWAGATPNLTIEQGAGRFQPPMHAYLRDPRWQASHRDVGQAEIALLRERADQYAVRAQAEGLPDLAAFEARIRDPRDQFTTRSAEHLRASLATRASRWATTR
ncbi:MAG: sugar phosphate isomerase/epimerase [Nocardioidaceae bacterium]|nr:sugar phosphate isomerase/epimerase [Nocardioidaceae bacterium]